MSQFVQDSAIFPSAHRSIVIPVTVVSLPVGAIPKRSPLCVPLAVQRIATWSPSAITWLAVSVRSGNASR